MANLSQEKRQRLRAFLETIREEHKDDDEVLIALGEIESELNANIIRRCFIFALVGYVNLRPLAFESAAQRPSERSSDGRRFKSCHFFGAKSVLLRSLPCSSSPNRTCCAWLRFGFLFFPPFPAYLLPPGR